MKAIGLGPEETLGKADFIFKGIYEKKRENKKKKNKKREIE